MFISLEISESAVLKAKMIVQKYVLTSNVQIATESSKLLNLNKRIKLAN